MLDNVIIIQPVVNNNSILAPFPTFIKNILFAHFFGVTATVSRLKIEALRNFRTFHTLPYMKRFLILWVEFNKKKKVKVLKVITSPAFENPVTTIPVKFLSESSMLVSLLAMPQANPSRRQTKLASRCRCTKSSG